MSSKNNVVMEMVTSLRANATQTIYRVPAAKNYLAMGEAQKSFSTNASSHCHACPPASFTPYIA